VLLLGGHFTKGRYAIPELPEVETVRRELAPWLTGQIITRAARVHAPTSPKYADINLAVGKRIMDVKRRGKFLLLPLVDSVGVPGWELIIHLGMTGAVKRVASDPVDAIVDATDDNVTDDNAAADNVTADNVTADNVTADNVTDKNAADDNVTDKNAADDNVTDENATGKNITDDQKDDQEDDQEDDKGFEGQVVAKHVRIRLELRSDAGETSYLLFEDMRRFGRFLVVPQGDYRSLPTLNSMGPEPFDEALTEVHFWQALQGSKTAIKTYLLSQRPIAGVGNIYADEALWEARIHPKTPAFRVSQKCTKALLVALRDVMAKSIKLQGTTLRDYRTVNGEVGQFGSHLRVYGKTDKPCPRCGHPIERLIIGGRSSHVCPSCQKRC
jgi:DNA-formamidopyrimidine glycosylase